MSVQPTDRLTRRFEFVPTEAVARSRANAGFISCPACRADVERYLFHECGARFVQCRSCDVVYVNPPARELRDYFDIPSDGGDATVEDHEHVRKELDDVLHYATSVHRAHRGSAPGRVVVAGRMADDEGTPSPAQTDAVRLTREQTLRLVHEADVSPIVAAIGDDADMVVLNQLLEACPRASDVVAELAPHLPSQTLLVVVYSNAASLPGRILRHNWRRFFEWKSVYFNSENLRNMIERAGLRFVAQSGLNTSYTVTRALDLAVPGAPVASAARRLGLGAASVRVPTGTYVSIFERALESEPSERLSVIVPVFNEAAYTRAVIDELLDKQFVVPHDVIIVESNSTDGTREIVRRTRGAPGFRSSTKTGRVAKAPPSVAASRKRPGRSSSSRTPTSSMTSTTTTRCWSRSSSAAPASCSAREPRARRLEGSQVRPLAYEGVLMNFAQLLFARTFNVLYQQRVTDVNTMFKVFRRECIDGVDFKATGFSFDIELACMLVENGYSPMEVPVNYVARGFDEGKKINFVSEFFPSFLMFFKCRFGRRGRT